MRTAVLIPPFTDPPTLVRLAAEAEAAGWDGAFYWDHLQFLPDAGLDVHDPWTLLGAAAARTERIVLGTLVTPLARRRPWVVAKHLTTLDHLSGGRVALGVGLGEPPEFDFAAFGEPSDARERAALLDEGLDVLAGLFAGPVRHAGPHYAVEADLLPRPVQRPRPPIWVGAAAPHRRPLARATRWDGIVPIGAEGQPATPDVLAAYLDGVERPPGWDVVAMGAPGVPAREYADIGATWWGYGNWPQGDWVADLTAGIRKGPGVD